MKYMNTKEKIFEKLSKMDDRLAQLEERLAQMDARLTRVESDLQAVRAAQEIHTVALDGLHSWAEDVAVVVRVPPVERKEQPDQL